MIKLSFRREKPNSNSELATSPVARTVRDCIPIPDTVYTGTRTSDGSATPLVLQYEMKTRPNFDTNQPRRPAASGCPMHSA